MKEQNKILSLKNKLLLLLIAGFVAFFAFGVRSYAVASNSGLYLAQYDVFSFYFAKGNFTLYCTDNDYDISRFEFVCERPEDTYTLLFMDGNGLKYYSYCPTNLESKVAVDRYASDGSCLTISNQKANGDKGYIFSQWFIAQNQSLFTDYYALGYSIQYMYSEFREFVDLGYAADYEPIEVPDFDSLESDYDFCLKGFSADNSILATWDGTVTDEYENEESFIIAYLGYAYKEQPAQIAVRELYNAKVQITDNQFSIPWDEVQHEDETLYLRYVEFVPYGRINPDKLFYPYIKGCSAYIYFSLDASGGIDSVKIPIRIDKDNLTTNIIGGTFDSSIPALSGVSRVDNGFADPLSSYSQSSTVKWSTVFNDSNYYIQLRTTFRYKLNADKVWSEITVDTSVPTGRYSCLVDNQSFTYTYGNYGPLFWKQDNSNWTDDDLDKQGNLQPIRDSIRIVHIDNGVVSYGPWTTFTLKNGIWQTGEVTGSYESDYLEEDNTGGSIVEDSEVDSNFLTDFDFTNISGVWDAFIGIFKNLFSFLGQFPDLFSKIFSFLPYEIRSMIYVSMVSICVLGLVKAVIK